MGRKVYSNNFMLTFCLARPMECICSCQGRLETESLEKFYQHPFIIFPSNECYGKAAHLLYDGTRSLSESLSFFMPCAVPESFVRGGSNNGIVCV